VTQYRYGVPVATKTWKHARGWRLQINIAPQEYIEGLRQFFEDRVFLLYPDGESSDLSYEVYWMEESFEPKRVGRPGFYSLTATFKETA